MPLNDEPAVTTSTAEPLPEINDNVPAPPVTEGSNEVFSLDAVTSDKPAPELKSLKSDSFNKDYQPTDKPKLTKEEALAKAQKENLEYEKSPENSEEDDEGGDNKSGEPQEEAPEKEPTEEEELKLHGNTKRDYAGFNANQVKILKRLDNNRFQAISTEWRALQSAANKAVELATQLEEQKKIAAGKGIPQTWYEHPEAYSLTPEFRQLSTQYAQYDAVEAHYTEQIAAIQDGKPWTAIVGVNPQTGELQYSPEQQPTPQAMANVNRALIQATTAKGQLQAKVDNLASNFANTHKQAASQIKNEIQGYLDKLHPEVKPVDKDVEMVTNMLPAMYKNHPLAWGFSQLVAMSFAQGRFLKKLLSEKEQAAKVAADTKLAGPRQLPKADPAVSPAATKGKVFNLKEILGDE